jgi:hypothetical protein
MGDAFHEFPNFNYFQGFYRVTRRKPLLIAASMEA